MRKKCFSYIIAFLIIITLNFIVPRLLPGDPLSAIYGEEVLLKLSGETREYINSTYNLDRPVAIQYVLHVISIFRGNLGYSIYYKKPVIELVFSYIPYTIILMGLGMLISTALGIVLGIESGWRRGKRYDRFILFMMIFFSGFPAFFMGACFLIIFGVILDILPFQGAKTAYSGMAASGITFDFLRHLILPLLSLVFVFTPSSYLLTRNAMISSIKEPYILLAKAKGLKDIRIRYGHAGRNSLIPVATHTGVRLGTVMMTGTLFIEIIFSYPGMGTLIYNSILNRDYPVIQGSFLFVAVLVLLINFLMDISYVRLDPRIEYAY
ncbi:MAG: ABC transporter permease [Actinobacteria bacterium]|nr:ABC transporter permease [Actinomycetota bacterium]